MSDAPWRGLDPADLSELRALGHRMMDDVIDRLATVRDRPVWQPMPAEVRQSFHSPLPTEAQGADAAYAQFLTHVLPYELGNTNPRFMGWVHGGGNAVGMLAELLAGALNANLGGRDQSPVEVERQVIRWAAASLGMPQATTGVLVTGTSLANLCAVLVARTRTLGPTVRTQGLQGTQLTAYASAAAHSCIPRAMDMAGLGTEALRLVATDDQGRLSLPALREAIANDRAAGLTPFLVVATAGSVDTGAIDPLGAIADLCASENLWFHADAAFGASLAFSKTRNHLIEGLNRADSVAFDFHKWAQAPYDAGCILVAHPEWQTATFAQNAAYLRREARGMSAGAPWPCDLGPDLSRGFRALKVWMSLIAYGTDAIGEVIDHTCDMAQLLATRIDANPLLERTAPVALNIVTFRYLPADTTPNPDRTTADIVADMQLSGDAAPSTTTINGRLCIRAALVNHRIAEPDIDRLIAATLLAGANRCLSQETPARASAQ